MKSAKECVKGKNTKKTFPSSERKAKGILEIIHSDVCGPMSSISLSGYVYYVSFIYDFSRKTWIYIMKTRMKYSTSSNSSKPLSRIVQKIKSRPFDQTMAENSHQMNSKNYVEIQGLRGVYHSI